MTTPLKVYNNSKITEVHTDKTYIYNVGICIAPDADSQPGCGIVQYEQVQYKNGTTTSKSHCIGRIINSQVTESERVL